jgi:uncharacterized membrane protein
MTPFPAPDPAAGQPGDAAEAAAARAEAAAEATRAHLDQTQSAAGIAQTAAQQAQAAATTEPSWIYGMVVVFLGIALLALIAAIVIASLTGSRVISTEVVSAATLILGGLIGVLAPTPGKKPS